MQDKTCVKFVNYGRGKTALRNWLLVFGKIWTKTKTTWVQVKTDATHLSTVKFTVIHGKIYPKKVNFFCFIASQFWKNSGKRFCCFEKLLSFLNNSGVAFSSDVEFFCATQSFWLQKNLFIEITIYRPKFIVSQYRKNQKKGPFCVGEYFLVLDVVCTCMLQKILPWKQFRGESSWLLKIMKIFKEKRLPIKING